MIASLLHRKAVSLIRSFWCVPVLLVLFAAVACSDDGAAPAAETPTAEPATAEPPAATEKLLAPPGNQLDVYDLATGEMTVLIPTSRYNIIRTACLLPHGSGQPPTARHARARRLHASHLKPPGRESSPDSWHPAGRHRRSPPLPCRVLARW